MIFKVACSILWKKVSTIVSIWALFSLECLRLSSLIISGRDNYLSSFFFFLLPMAFSNIPLRVAPDLVAPSPNLAIRDFSSSICAAFTLNLIFLDFKSNSVILASRAFPGENT